MAGIVYVNDVGVNKEMKCCKGVECETSRFCSHGFVVGCVGDQDVLTANMIR